jgi:hypothetical protein
MEEHNIEYKLTVQNEWQNAGFNLYSMINDDQLAGNKKKSKHCSTTCFNKTNIIEL